MRVLQRFHRLSLDLQLIGSYLLILGVGGIAISVVGSWIVATTMRAEAQRTVAHDAAMARALYQAPLRAAIEGEGSARGDAAATSLVGSVWSRLNASGDAGVVALYRGDRCVAAVPSTRLPAGTALPATARGRAWQGRTRLRGEAYLGAFEPIARPRGEVAGALYVGRREDSYTAVRNRVISSFFAIATVGFALVILITYRLIHALTQPIRDMVEATRRVAAGRFDHPVAVSSAGDIGLLAVSLNRMQGSLRQMRSELEEAARTLEDKVRKRTDELARMQLRMAQSERLASIGVLAAGVAHEINNPLGGILALTSLTLEGMPADDARRENLEEVVRQTRRCGEIVKHLLEFSRQHRVAPEAVDVNRLVEKTLALLERQSIFLNVRVARDLEPDLPAIVGDASQLQQVLVNVLMNAVQAMEERGTLTLRTRGGAGEVVLECTDTGCGIPREQIDHIFDPFFTTKESGQGTGLGLSIAYGIVTRHGGTIEVDSEPGAGTTFTIRLPLCPPPGGEPRAADVLVGAEVGS